MKKTLIVLLAVALVGAVAFAQDAKPTTSLTLKTWTGFAISSTDKTSTIVPYDYNYGGAGVLRAIFTSTAADGNTGFNSRVSYKYDGATPLSFDQLNGWTKLAGGLVTLRGGKLDDYTVAATKGDAWNGYGNTDGSVGLYVNLTPVEGFNLGFFQAIPTGALGLKFPSDLTTLAGTNLKNKYYAGSSDDIGNGDLVGFSYEVKDLGNVAAGWISDGRYSNDNGTAYFGVEVKAVPNLTAWFEGEATALGTNTITYLDQEVAYTLDKLTVGSYFGETFTKDNTYWGIEPSVAYKLTDTVTVNGLFNAYYNKKQDDSAADSPVVTKNLAFNGLQNRGVIGFGTDNDLNVGFGGSLSYAKNGYTVTVGDYYGVGAKANAFYTNFDLVL